MFCFSFFTELEPSEISADFLSLLTNCQNDPDLYPDIILKVNLLIVLPGSLPGSRRTAVLPLYCRAVAAPPGFRCTPGLPPYRCAAVLSLDFDDLLHILNHPTIEVHKRNHPASLTSP